MRPRSALLLPVTLLFAASAAAQTQVRGTVFDAYTNARLANVTVTDSSTSATARTDARGQFSLPCTGATTLVFRRSGYAAARHAVARCAEAIQVGLVPGAQSLAAVNVVGNAERPDLDEPQSVAILSNQALHRSSGLFLEQAVNLTPGVRMERRTMAGGQRITIRGYGNGSDAGNFIGMGYKAYFNGIPLTNAEGQTILDDVDFANLGRVDIIRGPASSIYGAGIGGVVNMYTARPDRMGTAVVQSVTSGSHGLLRSDTRLERMTDGASIMVGYGHQDYDSYRIHSASGKDYGTFLGEFRPSDRQTLSTFVSYAHSRDERAGELDSAEFVQKLNTGEDRYLNNDAHQAIESFRVGVTHSYRLSDRVENVATAYYSGNMLDEAYAVGLNSKSSQTFGARVVFNTDFTGSTLPLRGVSGVEFEKTNAVARGYGLTDLVLGALRSDLETQTMQYSIFTQWDASLPADFTLTAGASANFIEYAITDRMANSGNPTHQDASGRKVFDPVVTPRVALRRMFGPNISAYASVSQGYSPPTSSDAVIPFTGEANEGLKPERATQYEIGSKGNLFGNRLSYQVALFDMHVTDKLTSQTVFETDGTPLYSYTVNAGDQIDKGLELGVAYSLIDSPARFVSIVRPFVSYTYSDFTYDDFKSDNNDNAGTVDYTGKHVVGTAKNVFSAGVDAGLRSGVYGNVTYYRTGDVPVSYDNAHWAPGYSLLNAKVGVAREVGSRFALDAFVGGNNLTNSLYYTMVFLNHKFDSPTPPHMYLPGPYKATFYGGVKVTFRP